MSTLNGEDSRLSRCEVAIEAALNILHGLIQDMQWAEDDALEISHAHISAEIDKASRILWDVTEVAFFDEYEEDSENARAFDSFGNPNIKDMD